MSAIYRKATGVRYLAGNQNADYYIAAELNEAEIPIVEDVTSENDVPATIVGKIGGWTFRREWYYWVAEALPGEGVSAFKFEQLDRRVLGKTRPGDPRQIEYSDRLEPIGTIDLFHIFSQEELGAFVKLISSVAQVS